jgi:hypothetical protein
MFLLGSRFVYFSTLKMKAVCYLETSGCLRSKSEPQVQRSCMGLTIPLPVPKKPVNHGSRSEDTCSAKKPFTNTATEVYVTRDRLPLCVRAI